MKIAICVTNDIVYDQRMHRIATTLSKDNQVTIIGRRLSSTPVSLNNNYKLKYLTCVFNKGPLFYLEFNIRLFICLLRFQMDLIYACDPDTLPAAASVKVIRSKRGVYDSHEIFEETPEITNRPIVKSIWKLIERSFGPRMDIFITVNEALVKILSKKLDRNFYAIRNLPFLNPIDSTSNKSNILLYQGVLNKGRGLECAIQTMPFLPNYKLWIVGDGDIKSELEKTVDNLGLQEQVIFFGKITPKALQQITAEARYGLNLLSNLSQNYYYSLANKFFDYMAYGIPSINMNFPLYKEYCDLYNCGITIDELEPLELSNQIKEIDKSNLIYRQMAESSIKAHLTLNWEKEEQKFLSLF